MVLRRPPVVPRHRTRRVTRADRRSPSEARQRADAVRRGPMLRSLSHAYSVMRSKILLAFLLSALAIDPVQAQLRGHGGPVRAVAVSPDGKSAISGSFDSSAIRWSGRISR